MGRYRKVEVRIWNDAKFRGLSDDGKLAFLFVLTHPHLTPIGAMRATMPGLAAELEWSPAKFTKAFREALLKGLLDYDEKASFVALPNFLKHNPPQSPNVVKSWVKIDDLLPECEHKYLLYERVKAFAEGLGEAFAEPLPEVFRKPLPNQEQEQEQEQEKKQPLSSSGKPNVDVAAVVKHYQTHHPRARPGAKEKRLIRDRLDDGYGVEDLIAAIDGNHRDPHCCGQNDRGRTYHALALIMRDSSHVDDYMAVPAGSNGNPKPKTPEVPPGHPCAGRTPGGEDWEGEDGLIHRLTRDGLHLKRRKEGSWMPKPDQLKLR